MDRQVQTRMNDVMRKLINYIKTDGITLDHISTEDGRLKSAEGEKEIIASVKRFALKNENIEFIESEIRDWRDFELLVDNNIKLPVNIKLTSVNSKGVSGNDNVSSKEGLIWTFTNEEPSNNRSWPSLREALNNPVITSNRDYYFLIVDKNNLQDIWFTSFKQINSVKVNANNLPFQTVWTENRILSEKGEFDVFKLLFSTFQKGLDNLKERINSLEGAMKVIKEYENSFKG